MPGRVISLTVAFATAFAFNPYWPSIHSSEHQSSAQPDSAAGQVDRNLIRPMSEQAFDRFCKDRGYAGGVTLVEPDINPYSIRCKNSDGSLQEYDKPEDIHNFVTDACMWTYPGASRTDRLATMAKTYTAWECVNFRGYEGIPDFTKWCESKGLQLINREDVKYPAYRWFCANSTKSRVEGISVDKVCESQYGEDSLDRVFNVYAEKVADAWDCFEVEDE